MRSIVVPISRCSSCVHIKESRKATQEAVLFSKCEGFVAPFSAFIWSETTLAAYGHQPNPKTERKKDVLAECPEKGSLSLSCAIYYSGHCVQRIGNHRDKLITFFLFHWNINVASLWAVLYTLYT